MKPPFKIIYQDNHLIAVQKPAGILVQNDRSGDQSLLELMRKWLKDYHRKPGNVYLGLIHRIDRPVHGVVLLAKTEKALQRLNAAMRQQQLRRRYLAITTKPPPEISGQLWHHLYKNQSANRSVVAAAGYQGAKAAGLHYRLLGHSDSYSLVAVELISGRHHQIRVQLAAVGAIIRGDLKYGAPRSLANGGIDLLSWRMSLQHPIKGKGQINLQAELPDSPLWNYFKPLLSGYDDADWPPISTMAEPPI